MAIDADTARIVVDTTDSKPDTDVVRGRVAFLHLTRNADVFLTRAPPGDDDPFRGADTSAINIQGLVEVHERRQEDLSKWEFRFIQYVAVMEDYFSYAGRSSRGGMTSCNFASPPAMPADAAYNYMLDGHHGVVPYMNKRPPVAFAKLDNKARAVPGIWTASTDMDDHPVLIVPLTRRNDVTNENNYLYQLDRQLLFVTTFVARDTTSRAITPLAYVTWRAEWHAQYHWAGGDCIPYPVHGALEVGRPAKGAPTGKDVLRKDLADRVIHPVEDESKLATAIWSAAKRRALDHPEITNLNFYDKWGPTVPANFWT
jgi:hypothetical protein